MRRREFIAMLGGAAAAWPTVASAQQSSIPVIGYPSSFPAELNPKFVQAFRQGLSEAGLVEGRNVAIQYRWDDEGRYDRLPVMAADLVKQPVAVLFASPVPAAVAAKGATTTVPIVFAIGSDPIEAGLVDSINHPGANVTGATFLSVELGAKRLELLRDLVPKVESIGLLVNPNNPNAAPQIKHLQSATDRLGLKLTVLRAASLNEFDDAFSPQKQRLDAMIVSADPFFISHRDELVAAAARSAKPVVYYAREFVTAGGLLSYASSFTDAFHQAAIYVARILKGEKPADLPIMQPSKFELVLNLKTARTLGLNVPPTLLARADEVIE